jgi:hypothetical protein
MPIDAAELQRLYTVPPEEFVAARNATVKELRAAKDREAAAAVAQLRRPTPADWALNLVAAEHPEVVGAALDAAATVRRAQAAALEGRDGGDVRGALQDLRQQNQHLFTLAEKALARSGRPVGPQLPAITARLAEVAASDVAAEQLRAGHLGSAEVGTVDPFAGLAPAAHSPEKAAKASQAGTGKRAGTASSAGPASRPAAPSRSRPRAAPRASAAGRTGVGAGGVAERRQVERERRERQRLERAAAAARKSQASARARLAKAGQQVSAAAEAVANARAALNGAEARLAEAQDEERHAAEESTQADAALQAAEAAVGVD